MKKTSPAPAPAPQATKPAKVEKTPAELLAVRHRSSIVSIENGITRVKPIARKLSALEPVTVTLLPLAFPYRAEVGCEGVLFPNASGTGYEFKPSRRDSHLINVRPPKAPKQEVKAA